MLGYLKTIHWTIGNLENMKSGILEDQRFRKIRKLENWSIGMFENWRVGKLENWQIGDLENWKIGDLGDWNMGKLETCTT